MRWNPFESTSVPKTHDLETWHVSHICHVLSVGCATTSERVFETLAISPAKSSNPLGRNVRPCLSPRATMPSCSILADQETPATGLFMSRGRSSQYFLSGGCCESMCFSTPSPFVHEGDSAHHSNCQLLRSTPPLETSGALARSKFLALGPLASLMAARLLALAGFSVAQSAKDC